MHQRFDETSSFFDPRTVDPQGIYASTHLPGILFTTRRSKFGSSFDSDIVQIIGRYRIRTESAKKGTFYTGAQAFNKLTRHLKEVDSTVIFKTLLNDIIF